MNSEYVADFASEQAADIVGIHSVVETDAPDGEETNLVIAGFGWLDQMVAGEYKVGVKEVEVVVQQV